MELPERNLFPKSERLSLKKDIERLFDKGQSFMSYPLRIIYVSDFGESSSRQGVSVLTSVPKRRFKSAVKRNRIKRLVREAYRLNKNTFPLCEKRLHIGFLYICNDILTYSDIEKAVIKALKTICRKETSP
ncbi:MAG: ribonuclease P protein component [Tannerella sp.]|nr:ribonuclease P protein component [Tannerella sp.]